jgi:hypothetical protein
LNRLHRPELIAAEESQLVRHDVLRPLRFILPTGVGGIRGPLREGDVVAPDWFIGQPLRIGQDFLVVDRGGRRRKARDDVWVAAVEVPQVMEIAVGEENESAIL